MDVDKDNNTLVYNGENKLVTYNGGATNGGANYVYDGDSKRVKKIVGNETTIFVYNAMGQMVAEYTTTAPANPTISYLTSDTLVRLRRTISSMRRSIAVSFQFHIGSIKTPIFDDIIICFLGRFCTFYFQKVGVSVVVLR